MCSTLDLCIPVCATGSFRPQLFRVFLFFLCGEVFFPGGFSGRIFGEVQCRRHERYPMFMLPAWNSTWHGWCAVSVGYAGNMSWILPTRRSFCNWSRHGCYARHACNVCKPLSIGICTFPEYLMRYAHQQFPKSPWWIIGGSTGLK